MLHAFRRWDTSSLSSSIFLSLFLFVYQGRGRAAHFPARGRAPASLFLSFFRQGGAPHHALVSPCPLRLPKSCRQCTKRKKDRDNKEVNTMECESEMGNTTLHGQAVAISVYSSDLKFKV